MLFRSADEYPAKINLEFGDLRLQNPYVGHHPLYLYEQKDNLKIEQTCKFHDFVKPGINIVIHNFSKNFNQEQYLNWFQTQASDVINTYGKEQLLKFTGHPVVGRVVNLDDLHTVVAHPVLEFKQLIF